MKFLELQPAAMSADEILRLAHELKRSIDSARRGHDTDPGKIANSMVAELAKVQEAVPAKKKVRKLRAVPLAA